MIVLLLWWNEGSVAARTTTAMRGSKAGQQAHNNKQDNKRTTSTQQPNRQRKYVRSSPARALDLYRIPNHCAQQEQGTQQTKAHNQKLRQQDDVLMFLGLG